VRARGSGSQRGRLCVTGLCLLRRHTHTLLSHSARAGEGGCEGAPLEVRIPADCVTAANRQARALCASRHRRALRALALGSSPPPLLPAPQVRARQLWGTDVYTEDSDLVAVLVHTGHYALTPTGAHPPAGLSELRATIRPMAGQEGTGRSRAPCAAAYVPAQCSPVPPLLSSFRPAGYASTARHGIRSRAWGGAQRSAGTGSCSFRVEKVVAVMSGGAQASLDPEGGWGGSVSCATFMMGGGERGVHTRGGSEASRRGRYVSEVTLQFSLTNEPWLKYTLAAVADRGLKRAAWTSARLREEVLFLETSRGRYQLHWEGLGAVGAQLAPDALAALDAFTFAKCRGPPLELKATLQAGLPLPKAATQVLAKGLAWEAIRWGVAGVTVGGVHYPVLRCLFLPAGKA